MKVYKPSKGPAGVFIVLLAALVDIVIMVFAPYINSYEIESILNVFAISYTIYCLYYFIIIISLKYYLNDEYMIIESFFGLKKIKIDFKDIKGYVIHKNLIKGTKLSGIGNNIFAVGRSIVEKVGITYMYVTKSKDVIFLKTEDMSYGISPDKFDEFKNYIIDKGIEQKEFQIIKKKNKDIYKEKSFFIPFILSVIIIIVIVLNPFILYLKHKLPQIMPITFDRAFKVIQYGTEKQFAFRQMTYGVLNMIVLVCMYYASYFCAKYDKKSAYKYIYVALILAAVFLLMQIRVLIAYI